MLLSKPYQARLVNMLTKKPDKGLAILNKAVNNTIDQKALAGLLFQNKQDTKQ